MKGSEFVRLVRKLGRKRGIRVEFQAERGKGSHGTLHAMLKQLGLSLDDLTE